MNSIFIGNLPERARRADVENFLSPYGKLCEIDLKNGYGTIFSPQLKNNFRPFDGKNSGFVEFDDSRDAEAAVREMNGERLCGERVTISMRRGSLTCSGWLIQ